MFRRINILGGPCTGKSTVASYVFASLKEKGYNVEFVPEYVKRWTFINRKPKSFDQVYLFAQQMHAEDEILSAGIDYVVTECPIYLAYFYAQLMVSVNLLNILKQFEKKYPSIDIFLPLAHNPYINVARFHDKEEAMRISRSLESFLSDSSCPPSEFSRYAAFDCQEKELILDYVENKIKGTKH